jgi:hypothetical protein
MAKGTVIVIRFGAFCRLIKADGCEDNMVMVRHCGD